MQGFGTAPPKHHMGKCGSTPHAHRGSGVPQFFWPNTITDKNAVLKESHFSSTISRASNGSCCKADSTTSKSHGWIAGLLQWGVNLQTPLRHWVIRSQQPSANFRGPTRTALLAATIPLSVERELLAPWQAAQLSKGPGPEPEPLGERMEQSPVGLGQQVLPGSFQGDLEGEMQSPRTRPSLGHQNEAHLLHLNSLKEWVEEDKGIQEALSPLMCHRILA